MSFIEKFSLFIKGLEAKKKKVDYFENWEEITCILNIGISNIEQLKKAVDLYDKISKDLVTWLTIYNPILQTYQAQIEGYEDSVEVINNRLTKEENDVYVKARLENNKEDNLSELKRLENISKDIAEFISTIEKYNEILCSEIVEASRYVEEIDPDGWKEQADSLIIIKSTIIGAKLTRNSSFDNVSAKDVANAESNEVKAKLFTAAQILEEIKNGEEKSLARFEDYLAKKASEKTV